jgi:small-conductance mechanosensitive channel
LAWRAGSICRFWRRLTPNPFVGDLWAQLVRVTGVVLGIVLALNLIGATTLMATVLGGAGVIGIALGFAVRDALENYISSIMLSLRQPFRANDHVVVDGHEGKVVRLTSRATILMTLDGNHLRIPNSIVFKAVILNYTRNPERRLEFELGVDANDDPGAAISTGVGALAALDFILVDPAPSGVIVTVGDSNIVLRFMAWIDQSNADFLKARSRAIRATKMAVEAAGFTLPEPIYRLRLDQLPELPQSQVVHPGRDASAAQGGAAAHPSVGGGDQMSVRPDDHIDERIEAERRETSEEDLLTPKRPIE